MGEDTTVETKKDETTSESTDDGAEVIVIEEEKHPQYGMLHQMKRDTAGIKDEDEKKDNEDDNEDDNITDDKEKENEDKGAGEESANTETSTQITDKTDESLELPKLEEMDKDSIIAEYKNLQTKLSDKDKELKTVTTNSETQKKYQEFIDVFKKEGLESALQKFGTEFQLPNSAEVETYFLNKGKQSSDLGQWQKTELLEKIKEKFNIEPDDFEYDPSEAYKADTPSYFFRTQTELKEKELFDVRRKQESERSDLLEKGRAQVLSDLETIKTKYFKEDETELFEQKKKEFDDLPQMLHDKKVGPERDPFSVLNLFRATHFDFLVEREVEKAIAEVHEEYKKKGMVLKSEKEQPTDVTKMKGTSTSDGEPPKKTHSMLDRMIQNTVNKS